MYKVGETPYDKEEPLDMEEFNFLYQNDISYQQKLSEESRRISPEDYKNHRISPGAGAALRKLDKYRNASLRGRYEILKQFKRDEKEKQRDKKDQERDIEIARLKARQIKVIYFEKIGKRLKLTRHDEQDSVFLSEQESRLLLILIKYKIVQGSRLSKDMKIDRSNISKLKRSINTKVGKIGYLNCLVDTEMSVKGGYFFNKDSFVLVDR